MESGAEKKVHPLLSQYYIDTHHACSPYWLVLLSPKSTDIAGSQIIIVCTYSYLRTRPITYLKLLPAILSRRRDSKCIQYIFTTHACMGCFYRLRIKCVRACVHVRVRNGLVRGF